MKLYVGNFSLQTSRRDLQQLFSRAGTVESVSVFEEREGGQSRDFAFIKMSSTEEGKAAIQLFNGLDVGGHALHVNEFKPGEDRTSSNFGGSGNYGRGRSRS